MSTESFTEISGLAAPLLRDNLDAMTLAPRTPAEKGGGSTQGGRETVLPSDLFAFLRYDQGVERPDFVLNDGAFRTASFLIAGNNFGCGSAREHAVWALCAFGIRCVIAPSFGPLFYGNCFKNGVIPITLAKDEVLRIAAECGQDAPHMTLDLAKHEVRSPAGRVISFTLPAFRENQLINGLDEIDMSLRYVADIDKFENSAARSNPWLFRAN